MSLRLTSCNLPEHGLAFTNKAYASSSTFSRLQESATRDSIVDKSIRCEVKSLVLNVEKDRRVPDNQIALGKLHRTSARIGLSEEIVVRPYAFSKSTEGLAAATHFEVALLQKETKINLEDRQLDERLKATILGQILTLEQVLAVSIPVGTDSVAVTFRVTKIEPVDLGSSSSDVGLSRVLIAQDSEFLYTASPNFPVNIQTKKLQQRNIFRQDFNFEQLGIGGLDQEFADIFRRAFASRIFPSQVIAELGITHVRGMLLFGPPGTGKTLIARQIGKALRAREPKIVNGPEILNKYVGQSEENIRALFKEAEEEYKRKGDGSSLHIIIFDEIDAICKQRGSNPSGAGVNDSIVNQLLSKIDGVDSLNNILLIGMTNRMDMMDEALLRPGRLEVHVEIGLPDEGGRVQILKIHTESMRNAKRLDRNVSLQYLAEVTKNFSGAEIAGLVRSAASYAFGRNVNFSELSRPTNVDDILVTSEDFRNALEEVKPAFGAQDSDFAACVIHGIIPFSAEFERIHETVVTLSRQVQQNSSTPLLSVLIQGATGSGKTALAAHVAMNSQFPFMKLISPDDFVGFSEAAKVAHINKTFQDAYKSQISFVLLDSVERLIDYTPIGPRFSNIVLQSLLVLLKRPPKKDGRRIFVIATSSESQFMQDSGLARACNVTLDMPLVVSPSNLKRVLSERTKSRNDLTVGQAEMIYKSIVSPLGIKQLLLALEMASEFCRPGPITCDQFLQSLQDCGYQ